MSKHGLVSNINNNFKTCEICIQTKMIKKYLSKSEKNTEILDLVYYNM